jgi:phenylacetate-CoA ligase
MPVSGSTIDYRTAQQQMSPAPHKSRRRAGAETSQLSEASWDERLFKYGVFLPVTALRGQPVWRHLERLEQTQHLPMTALRDLQLERLGALFDRARATVPHYRDGFAGLTAPRGLEDIRQLPITEKLHLRERPDRFRADRIPARCTPKTTGGSTGEPLTILKTPEAMAHELAAMWRGYRWAGVDIGARQARFWGVPFTRRERLRAHLIDVVCHRRRCSAFAFDSAAMAGYERQLARFRPTYFYGYVSMLVAFANYFRTRSLRMPFRLQAVVTTSEVLTPGDRALLEEVFEAPVFNEYGCGELGTIAHECEAGRLHINDENLIVEVLDGERPCAPGEKGELVVTELHNLAMPLIRYRTGDFGAIGAEPCPCGRALTVLDHVFGRAYDFVTTRDGRRFHGEFLVYVFEEAQRHHLGVGQFQVRQETLTQFHIRIVPGPGFSERSEQAVLARMREHLGPDIEARFEIVDAIPRERSGKMRVIIGMPGETGAQD